MDSFEHIVSSLLQRRGFWTRTCLKVELTKEEKVEIDRPSSPRWEIDVVGYRPGSNQIFVVECKSYLDSAGVRMAAFDGSHAGHASRYKLFTEERVRRVVLGRLHQQLVTKGLALPEATITLCLAAGKIHGDPEPLKAHFAAQGWELWSREWLIEELKQLADSGYENSIEAVLAKILLRE